MICEHGNPVTLAIRPIDRAGNTWEFGEEYAVYGCEECRAVKVETYLGGICYENHKPITQKLEWPTERK